MGGSRSPSKEVTKVPGAGSYNPAHESTKKQLPSYSMKQKLGSSLGSDNKVPGPGNYEASLKNKRNAP